MKEDVLKDLPPKITQDYYCQLSPIQQLLYEDFAKEQKDKNKNDKSHIFAALQYLRKVCNHPKLVLQNSDHKHYNLVQKLLAESNSNLNALRQVWDHPCITSAKMVPLAPSDTTLANHKRIDLLKKVININLLFLITNFLS